MSGIIGVSPDMKSGVIGESPMKYNSFRAYVTGDHSKAHNTWHSWKEDSPDSMPITTQFDYGSCFTESSGTFQPKVAGIYHISWNVIINNLNDGALMWSKIIKEGDATMCQVGNSGGTANALSSDGTFIIEMNGTTNTLRLQFYFEGATDTFLGAAQYSMFSGYRVG